MNKEELYINKDRYEEERKRHKGEYHPTEKRGEGGKAQLWVGKDIAHIIGLHHVRWSDLINGRYPIRLEYLQKLGNLWGCNWKWLCGKSDIRDPLVDELNSVMNTVSKSDREWTSFLAASLDYFRFLGYDVTSVTSFADAKEPVVILYRGDRIITIPAYKLLLILNNMKTAAEAAVRAQFVVMLSEDEETAERFMPDVHKMIARKQNADAELKNYSPFRPRWEATSPEELSSLSPEAREDLALQDWIVNNPDDEQAQAIMGETSDPDPDE